MGAWTHAIPNYIKLYKGLFQISNWFGCIKTVTEKCLYIYIYTHINFHDFYMNGNLPSMHAKSPMCIKYTYVHYTSTNVYQTVIV